jgi:superfamily II DNA or RNA helicase
VDVSGAVVEILEHKPSLTAREIARELLNDGLRNVDKSVVNRCLFGHRRLFKPDNAVPPHWGLIRVPARQPEAPPQPARAPLGEGWSDALALYPWQKRALNGWAKHGYRGVVEAVTGAGKTRLALAAIDAEVRRGGSAAAIVPTLDLQRQWLREIETHLVGRLGRGLRVASLGGGRTGDLRDSDILVATAQSACQWSLGLRAPGGLLIADEVHHYGAERWAEALEQGFERRLGLTATYQRDDRGVEDVLDPYFGPYRYALGYGEALADDVIAHFKIAFIGVKFTDEEESRYLKADETARRRRGTLIREFGLTPEPFGTFMRQVQLLSKSGEEGARHAGLYLSAFSNRRKVLASASAKFDCLTSLAPAIKSAGSTILFTQTRESAQRGVDGLRSAGVPGDVLHAELEASARREIFDDFRDGLNTLIAAPMLLDEGVDVPDADLAIVLASSRSRRQVIQRMGRVIRKKPDGRLARVAILYVDGTSEDPAHGAHEDFIDFVTDAADNVVTFGGQQRMTDAVAYLSRF